MKVLLSFVYLCLVGYGLATNSTKPLSSTLPQSHGSSQSHSSPPRSYYQPLSHPPHSQAPPHYTTVQFVQTWAPGYCKEIGSNCRGNYGEKFYIHGLWPANSMGGSLRNCRGSHDDLTGEKLDPMISDIKRNLKNSWQSIKGDPEILDFWAYQWRTHGVCSSQTIPDPRSYLQKGIDAKGKANLLAILDRANIRPGLRYYSKAQIQAAIGKALGSGLTIYITCVARRGIYLKEIYLCMDAYAVKFIPCPAKADSSSCGTFPQDTIQFPPT